MTDKQKIKEEIERRIAEGSSKNYISEGALALESLLDFIDSLPEQPTSDGLEEEIEKYFSDWLIDLDESKIFCQIARHFAEWQHGKDFDDLLQSEMKFPKEFYEKGRFDMRGEIMKDAIECNVHQCEVNGIKLDGVEILSDGLILDEKIYKDGDKVKIIILKEE